MPRRRTSRPTPCPFTFLRWSRGPPPRLSPPRPTLAADVAVAAVVAPARVLPLGLAAAVVSAAVAAAEVLLPTRPNGPRIVVQFPSNPSDMLLSGTLAGGEAIANRALAVDVTLGQGHIVMFALRPFWRWQTQGTYFLAFNAILNWNHLDAGKAVPAPRAATDAGQN